MIKTFQVSKSSLTDCPTKTRKKRVDKNMVITKGGTHNVTPHVATNTATNAASTDSSTWLKYPHNAPVPPQANIQFTGGKGEKGKEEIKHIKVELKKKISEKKVHLNPKIPSKIVPKKKIKKSRKFILGISKFHKRITRAKKACKKMNELSLDKLKEKLIKDGLIKSTSKAPESVLRQIANDAAIVNKRAL